MRFCASVWFCFCCCLCCLCNLPLSSLCACSCCSSHCKGRPALHVQEKPEAAIRATAEKRQNARVNQKRRQSEERISREVQGVVRCLVSKTASESPDDPPSQDGVRGARQEVTAAVLPPVKQEVCAATEHLAMMSTSRDAQAHSKGLGSHDLAPPPPKRPRVAVAAPSLQSVAQRKAHVWSFDIHRRDSPHRATLG